MSATNAPFGLRPAFHPSGLDRAQALANGILAVSTSGINNVGYGTNILKNQAVKYNAAGYIEVATAGDAFVGAFSGCEWTDTTGRRRISNYWPASESFQTGSVVVYFYNDPLIVYEIQSDATIAQTLLNAQFDLSNASAGSSVTGLSQATLGVSTATTSAVAQLRVVDLAPYPDNAWGDTYVILRVTISEHQNVANINAY